MNDSMKTDRPESGQPGSAFVGRRRFLGASAASLALSSLPAAAVESADGKPKRVGLIGAGWYGKSDLWRLMQVAPVEVVSICDPDSQMIAGALEIHAERAEGTAKPRTYVDYRKMLEE